MQTKFQGILIVIVGLAICCMGVLTMRKPPLYRAEVWINIFSEPDNAVDRFGNPLPPSYDPYFIQTEFEVILSDLILGKVVDQLDLSQKWGNRYQGGIPFKRVEAIGLLKRRVSIGLLRNTRITEVGVVDEDPAEATLIANTLVNAYRDHRKEQYQLRIRQSIKALEDTRQEQEQKIGPLKMTLGKLKTDLHVPDSLSDDQLKTNYPDYFAAKQQLEKSEWLKTKLDATILTVKDDEAIGRFVEIADIAKPPIELFKRYWPKGLATLVAGSGCVGFGLKRILR